MIKYEIQDGYWDLTIGERIYGHLEHDGGPAPGYNNIEEELGP